MIVDKKSWHYRVLLEDLRFKLDSTWGGSSKKTTLCAYFWMVVFSALVKVFAGVVATFIAFSTISFVGMFTYGIIWGFPELTEGWDLVFGTGLFAVGLVILVGMAAALHVATSHTKVKTDVEREPGLLRQWVRAKKSKYCPIVEFTEK